MNGQKFAHQLHHFKMTLKTPVEAGTYLYKEDYHQYGSYKLLNIKEIELNDFKQLMYFDYDTVDDNYWKPLDELNGYFSDPLDWNINFK